MLGKFLLFQGFTYHLLGGLLLFVPDAWTAIGLLPDFASGTRESLYLRCFGFTVFYIGLFYDFAGLANSRHFALCSLFTRAAFVPTLFAMFLSLGYGLSPLFAAFFGLADPAFGVLTYLVAAPQLISPPKRS